MKNKDFQNGLIVGMVSGGVVEVIDTTEIDNLETLIDESGVLDSTEGTVSEKVEQLIDLVEENTLPDWDDDSPIIASGYGYYEWVVWELTEKGTLRWKQDKSHPNYFEAAFSYSAGWSDSAPLNVIRADFLEVAHKVRQVYIDDVFKTIYLGHMPNCERIRIPEKVMGAISLTQCPLLKEINFVDDGTTNLGITYCSSLEKLTLSPLRTKIASWDFRDLARLKEINLENITHFAYTGLIYTPLLNKDLVCSPNLTKIEDKAFQYTSIKSVKFQNSVDNLPTLSSGSFTQTIGLTDIYCPWSEGEVANAPWGATNATIHYNYVEGEETNADS
jgi:hypothetical protein